MTLYTTAPIAYDAEGGAVKRTGRQVEVYGIKCQEVEVPPNWFDWQQKRYLSGGHAAFEPRHLEQE